MFTIKMMASGVVVTDPNGVHHLLPPSDCARLCTVSAVRNTFPGITGPDISAVLAACRAVSTYVRTLQAQAAEQVQAALSRLEERGLA